MPFSKPLLVAGLSLCAWNAIAVELVVTERDSFISIETFNLGGIEEDASTTDLTAPFSESVSDDSLAFEEPGGDMNIGGYGITHTAIIEPTQFSVSAAVTGFVDSNGSGGGPVVAGRAETAIVFFPTEDTFIRIEGEFVGVSSTNQNDPRTVIALQPRFAPSIYNNHVQGTPWVGFLQANREYRLLMFAAVTVAGNNFDTDDASFDYTIAIVPDTDDDGIQDVADNCITVINPDQRDADGDGIGSLCDADFDQNCQVNVIDLGLLRASFFGTDANTDINGDGVVNVIDLGLLRTAFFNDPGPSGVANICDGS
ncbi:MAG: hypothetical protein AB8G16_15040 [Gammaproteobacteria bacterium]